MIRQADVNDVGYFCAAAKRYLKDSGDGEWLSFDEQAFSDRFETIVTSKLTIALVDDLYRGHILGSVIESLWNPEERLARVHTLWVMPQCRGHLLARSLIRAFEKQVGNTRAIMIDRHEALQPEVAGKLYELVGYKPIQTLYVKVLNGH